MQREGIPSPDLFNAVCIALLEDAGARITSSRPGHIWRH
jgi:hypothetical protein